MSDYLTYLLSQAHGDQGAIRPRLPARFETPAQAVEAEPAFPEVSPAEQPGRKVPARPPTPAGTPHRQERAEPPAALPASFVVRPSTIAAPRYGKPERSGMSANSPPDPRPLRSPSESVTDRRKQAAIAPQETGPESVSPPHPLAPAVPDDLPAAPPRPSQTPAAPTINVTIGRVEVRAVPPARTKARNAASRRPAPPLSLDDYLARRKEGER